MEEMGNSYSISVAEGKRPLGRHLRRWEDNIIMDIRKQSGKLWTGFIWLRIGTSGGLF
jgi:hypothetical protein